MAETKESPGKADYLEKKEQEKQQRKMMRLIAASEQTIADLEQQIKDVEQALASPLEEGQDDMQTLFERHHSLKQIHKDEMTLWAERVENLENIPQ